MTTTNTIETYAAESVAEYRSVGHTEAQIAAYDLTPADFVACRNCRYLRHEHLHRESGSVLCRTAMDRFAPEDEPYLDLGCQPKHYPHPIPAETEYGEIVAEYDGDDPDEEACGGEWRRIRPSDIRFAAWKAKQ